MPKIIKFRDEYYQECQWTGMKLTSRYGIPKEKARNKDDREYSFADGACAVAWVEEQSRLGKMEPARCAKLLELISKDLGLEKLGRTPTPAPKVDPANPDLSYRASMPWMHKPRIYVPVQEDVAIRKNKEEEAAGDSSSSVGSDDPGKGKKMFYLYTVGTAPDQVDVCSLPFKAVSQLPVEVKGKTFYSVTTKSKDVIILSSGDSAEINHQVNSLLGINCEQLKGTCYLIMKKPLHKSEKKKKSGSLPSSDSQIADRVLKENAAPASAKKRKTSG